MYHKDDLNPVFQTEALISIIFRWYIALGQVLKQVQLSLQRLIVPFLILKLLGLFFHYSGHLGHVVDQAA